MARHPKIVIDTLLDLLPTWEQHLQSEGKSPRTVSIYLGTARELLRFLGPDTLPTDVTHRDIQRYLVHLSNRPNHHRPDKTISPGYVNQQFRSLQQLFRWLVQVEREIEISPMARLTAPVIPDKLVPIIPDQDIMRVLGTCSRTSFIGRRDNAIIRMFADTGARRAEILDLMLDDVDMSQQVIYVVGKGNRPRIVPFGDRTADAVRRYLRARNHHVLRAATDAVWIGGQGPLTPEGLQRMLNRRTKDAGVDHINPHRFRHTAAHAWLAAGHNQSDLMRLAGWKSPQMLNRYGASAADERARDAHRRAALGDRF